MSNAVATAFGFEDTLVKWSVPSDDQWDKCVIDVNPEGDGGKWLALDEAREYAANIIAACDAAETYRDTTEETP